MTIRFETKVAGSDLGSEPIGRRSSRTTLAGVVTRMPAQILELTCSQRNRSRLACLLPDGQGAAIILPAREFMHPGDRLLSTCGQHCVQIEAASEHLIRIEAASAFALMRVVYHLANRHVPAMLTPDAVLIEPDSVLADMVVRLGATVLNVQAPFLPEAGAYSSSHSHAHSHSPEHQHEHLHDRDHRHGHQHGHHHGDQDPLDVKMGRIGEMLSRQAHEKGSV